MIEYALASVTTRDDIVLQGIYHAPEKNGGTAILWVHGLTGNFYGDAELFERIVKLAGPAGIGFASFNTRGHDMISGLRKTDRKSPTGFSHAAGGSGQEVFTDCVYDIDAGISFLAAKGYRKVALCGHSTGANKVCYYAGTKKDTRVAGVCLAGPLSDRISDERTNPHIATTVRKMRHMIEKGKGDYVMNNLVFFPITPKRYVSMYGVHTAEDVFDYAAKNAMKTFSKIRKPLLVVLSGSDEYADRPAEKIRAAFDTQANAVSYASTIIAGATHGYDGKEEQFASVLVDWVKGLI